MKAWLVLGMVLVGAVAVGIVNYRNGREHRELMARAKADAAFVADEVIRRAAMPRSMEDKVYGKGRMYEHCWASPAQDYLYKGVVLVDGSGGKFMTLTAYELPHDANTCRCHALEILLQMLLGELQVLKEERFTDDGHGVLEDYCRYVKHDGNVFVTPRDRDIGRRAGVVASEGNGDYDWKMERYAEVLKAARSLLETKKK